MTNYYVRTDGSDSNSGLSNTVGGAWRNIANANGNVVAGDIINVVDGTYTYATGTTQGILTSTSGSAGNVITYRSINQYGAKLVSTGTEILWKNTGNYVTVDGFDMSGSGNLGYYTTGSNSIVSNNYIHDILLSGGPTGNGGAGIDTTGANSTIFNNKVINIDGAQVTGTSQVHGIYIAADGAYVYNNLVVYIAAFGLHQWHAVSTSTWVNNTVASCGGAGALIGCNTGISENNYLGNNIFANNGGYSIREYVESGGVTQNNTYRNNTLYNPSTSVRTASGDVISGDLTSNPLFVNYLANGTGDYTLQSGSPSIDSGISTNAPVTDLLGVTRPQNGSYDRGAYEYAVGGGGGGTGDGVAGSAKNWRRSHHRGYR